MKGSLLKNRCDYDWYFVICLFQEISLEKEVFNLGIEVQVHTCNFSTTEKHILPSLI